MGRVIRGQRKGAGGKLFVSLRASPRCEPAPRRRPWEVREEERPGERGGNDGATRRGSFSLRLFLGVQVSSSRRRPTARARPSSATRTMLRSTATLYVYERRGLAPGCSCVCLSVLVHCRNRAKPAPQPPDSHHLSCVFARRLRQRHLRVDHSLAWDRP